MSEAHATQPKHPYHLVDPSPWPFVGAIAAFVTAIGGVMVMHDKSPWIFVLGIALVLATMFFWWRDVIREANSGKYHTAVVQLGLRYGMILFIASEVMFFAAFFWAYFGAAFYPTAGVWPPADIQTFDPFDLPFLNTLILLMSGCTVTWAHHALIEGNRRDLIRAYKGHFTPERHFGFEAAAWYWHFVDVVWLFLFVWIYWWGS